MRNETKKRKSNVNLKSGIFKELANTNWWVQSEVISKKLLEKASLLAELDKTAYKIENSDKENKKILEEKIKAFCNTQKSYKSKSWGELSDKEREQNNQLFEFFAELKSYQELGTLGFKGLKLGEGQTPDIHGHFKDRPVFVEVKNIRPPKEEENSFAKKGYHENPKSNIPEIIEETKKGLIKKIEDDIKNAVSKFKKVDASLREQRVLIINYQPSIPAERFSGSFFLKDDLPSILGTNYFERLEKHYEILIGHRKYFN